MKNTKYNFSKLLNEYIKLKDELKKYEPASLYKMDWDIEGYYAESYDYKYLFDDLYNQVKACRNLLKGYKELHYIFYGNDFKF